ncbi:MAG: hypothetical protein RL088_2767, partial [Verrucomicrobiota bacterium]
EVEESKSEPVERTVAEQAIADAGTFRERSEDDIARIKDLEKMEIAKQREARAAEKTLEARTKLQLLKGPAWREIVAENMEKFEALRAKAAQSPDKSVPCSICDARGVLEVCVICDRSGKCPTCQGTGTSFNDVCPTCQKGGKCFLCSGSGKMPCPFCQSSSLSMEAITPTTPVPSTDIPLGMPKAPSVPK